MAKGRVLIVAGSDSSGGAGVEADQKVVAAHGCYAMTAITALTAQNTLGVVDIHLTPPDFVEKLIKANISDVGVDVVKTGMLGSAETIRAVAKALFDHVVTTIVVDPVMTSTSGSQLLPREAIHDLRELLLGHTTVLTPNVPEALLLLSSAGVPANPPQHIDDLIMLAKAVQSLGPKYVLLKGGHVPLDKYGNMAKAAAERALMIDILYGQGEVTRIESAYQSSKNTHGTGCSLASAIACNLANGLEIIPAVKRACRYVEAGIRTSTDLGRGNGPINHFHSTYTLPFAPDRFIEYLLERPDIQRHWRAFTEHPFVSGLADGTLPVEAFKHYLIQDYLFLIQFARANALASYKSRNIDDIAAAAKLVGHVHREMKLHIDYCGEFGLTKNEIEASEESQACTAYTRYVLDIGQSEDWLALQVALAPCLIGYGEIAKRVHADPKTKREGNIYWKWIETYVAGDYLEAVRVGSRLIEKRVIYQSPSRIEELVKIFIHACKMEAGFWANSSDFEDEYY